MYRITAEAKYLLHHFFFDRVKCDGLEKISNNKVKIILDQGQ